MGAASDGGDLPTTFITCASLARTQQLVNKDLIDRSNVCRLIYTCIRVEADQYARRGFDAVDCKQSRPGALCTDVFNSRCLACHAQENMAKVTVWTLLRSSASQGSTSRPILGMIPVKSTRSLQASQGRERITNSVPYD